MLFSCITATSQSDTSYTAVYAGVGSFVVTDLICVIIVLAILRYDIIVFIIFFQYFSEKQILTKMIRADIPTMKTTFTIYSPSGRILCSFRCRLGNPHAVNPVLRGHLWDNEEMAL